MGRRIWSIDEHINLPEEAPGVGNADSFLSEAKRWTFWRWVCGGGGTGDGGIRSSGSSARQV